MGNDNKWTATTNTSWIFFDGPGGPKMKTGVGGEEIKIYIEEASGPTTDVIGKITFTANGSTFDKEIKRCSPTVESTEKVLDFCVDYGSQGANGVGPCENGTTYADSYGIKVKNITLTTTETYSNGTTESTTENLSNSDVNIYYTLPDGNRYNSLPSNNGKDREVTVKAYLKSDESVYAPTSSQSTQRPTCYKFTQRGVLDSNGNVDTSRLIQGSIGYESESMNYTGFDIKNKGISVECEASTYTFDVIGKKYKVYGAQTGLTECNNKIIIDNGSAGEETNISPIDDVTFSVAEEQYASFNRNVLTYLANETRTSNRDLHITARLNANGQTASTVFTVKAGNTCGKPLYLVFKSYKDGKETYNVDFSGNTLTLKYYLAESEDASESMAVNSTNITFKAPQGVSVGNASYSNGVYTRIATFTQNQNRNGEEGINWVFEVSNDEASNTPKSITIYQANKREQIIPNCDYFIFNYIWTENDGKDLDSLTRISNCPMLSGKTVGWQGTAEDEIINFGNKDVYAKKVTGIDGKLYLKWGGDNRCNGAEYTIICLKNLIDDYKENKISFISNPNNDIVYIDIYANWYMTKINGYMNIIYSQYSGLTTGGYNAEIKETLEENNCPVSENDENYRISYYASIGPNPGKCSNVAEKVSTEQILVDAEGSSNAYTAKNINLIDTAYTHVLRLNYNLLTKTPSIEPFN